MRLCVASTNCATLRGGRWAREEGGSRGWQQGTPPRWEGWSKGAGMWVGVHRLPVWSPHPHRLRAQTSLTNA